MIDIRKEKIDFPCPDCGKNVKATLEQVAREDTVKCSCGQDIKLTDKDGGAKKSIRKMDEAFKDLEKVFKKFGK